MHAYLRSMLMLTLLSAALPSHAQHVHAPGVPAKASAATAVTPANAGASADKAPAITYSSALKDYQAYADEKVMSWQESNERVREAGGWRSYAREAAQPDTGPGTSSASPASPSTPAQPGSTLPPPAPRYSHGKH